MRDHVAEDVLLFASLFSMGELEVGINRADDPARERAQVDLFMDNVAVLMPDSGPRPSTAEQRQHWNGRASEFLRMTSGSHRWRWNVE